MEEWRDIPTYEKYYQVSNLGRFKSLSRLRSDGRTLKERIRKTRPSSGGYHRASLHKDGKIEDRLLHRVIAEMFVPNPNNYPLVGHIDNDINNNASSNLIWCTQLQNMRHCVKSGRRNFAKGVKIHTCKLDELQVKVIKSLKNTEISPQKIANYFKVSLKTIYTIMNGSSWKHIE